MVWIDDDVDLEEHAMDDAVVIGIDFGSLSGRAVVLSVADGAELGTAVQVYEHGSVERTLPGTDIRLPADWALQMHADYLDVLRIAVPAALKNSGVDASRVVGIGTDFTASTMIPVLADGTPLADLPEFAGRLHAHIARALRHHARHPDQAIALVASEQPTTQ